MADEHRIGIIGSGIAGLACARRLADAGWTPVVFDKGRGLGGRTATRRTSDGAQFDHGAQYVTAHGADFEAVLQHMVEVGAATRWDQDPDTSRYVGTPGMTALSKYLAAGLDVRQRQEVTTIEHADDGWAFQIDGQAHQINRVVVTAPAPQTARLLGSNEPLAAEIATIRYQPCLTLMVQVSTGSQPEFVARLDPDDPISWIANDSSKPGRPGKGCWVAQANPQWSTEHLELSSDEIAKHMLPLVCKKLSVSAEDIQKAIAHRWRYARVVEPLGRPFACDPSKTLYAGGDWCLGARVEAAWSSGDAIARDMLRGA